MQRLELRIRGGYVGEAVIPSKELEVIQVCDREAMGVGGGTRDVIAALGGCRESDFCSVVRDRTYAMRMS